MSRAFEWISTKLYIGFKRIFIRNKPVCASQILRRPESILIVLPIQEEELAAIISWVKRWMASNRKTLVVTNFQSSNGNTMCCDKLVPFSEEFYRFKDSLTLHHINLLIDLNEKAQDRSRMISLVSRAKLRVASFSDSPFFNCQIKIKEDLPIRSTELLRILEGYLAKK